MQKTCKQCSSAFEITQEDFAFYDKVSPVFHGLKYSIPAPTLCPECREQRRMAARNEHTLFSRNCSKTGEKIISMYPENTLFPVIKASAWWNDENDATTHGKSIDFTKSVFDQIHELQQKIPRIHTFRYANDRQINSEYTNCAGDLKDCYLVFASLRDERCFYSIYINDCYECSDCFFIFNSQLCYECIDLSNCYNLSYSNNCKQCKDSAFLVDCRNCSNCIACIGLRNKEFCIFNKQYSEQEYKDIKEKIIFNKQFKQEFNKLISTMPRKFYHGDNNEDCIGDHLWNNKDSKQCFDTTNSRDCKYCTWFDQGKDCMDFYAWGEAELCYEVSGGGEKMYQSCFSSWSYGSKSSYYLDMCSYCSDCFACIGLKHKKYCILNKQYTKEEYEKLVPQIIEYMKKTGEWGEFFPVKFSSFAYNNSVAQDYYPLTKEQVLANGWKWKEETDEIPQVSKIIPAQKLPDSIQDIPDDVLNWAIKCEVTNRPFKIQKAELAFYRKMNLPIPRRHPDQRHKDRLALRNPRKLWKRNCGNCGKGIQTSYAPERPEKVFCEECYLKTVY